MADPYTTKWPYVDPAQSATLTATGMTTSPTCTVTYRIMGNVAIVNVPAVSGTSNANTFTLTGWPSVIQPVSKAFKIMCPCTNNGAIATDAYAILSPFTPGVLTLIMNQSSTGWTNSGMKGLDVGFSGAFILD